MSSLFQGGPDTNLSYTPDSGAQGGQGANQAVYQDINPNDITNQGTGLTAGQLLSEQQQKEAYTNWYNENQANRQGFQNELTQSQNRAAPTMSASLSGNTSLNAGNFNQDRAQQSQLVSQLQAQAAGQGPSLATQQLKQGQEQAISQQMAMLGSQRGASNAASGMRQAALQGASTMAQTNQSAAGARIQEQLNAQGQLGSAINNMQGQDLGLAGQNAQLQQANNLANAGFQNSASQNNLQAYLQNQQMNQQLQGSALTSMAGLNQQDQAAMQAGQQAQLQQYLARMGANVSGAQIGATEQSQALAAAVSALGSGAAASDERGKILTLSPGNQKVLTVGGSNAGANVGSAADTGQAIGTQAATPPGNPQLATGLKGMGTAITDVKPMWTDNSKLGALPQTVGTPQPNAWMQQASALNQVSNGTIALSPGGQKMLTNTFVNNNPYAPMPVERFGGPSLPSSSATNNLNNGMQPKQPNGFSMNYRLGVQNPVGNVVYNNPQAQQPQPLWQPPPQANPSQQGREARAMSGGNASQMQSFLSSMSGQGGSNGQMLNQAQGATSYGNAPPPPQQPQAPAPKPQVNTTNTLGAPNANTSSSVARQIQQAPIQQTGINAPSPGPSQMGAGMGGNISNASPSFIPAINSPVVQSTPTNAPQTIQTAGALSPEGQKVLEGDAHTADQASDKETAANTQVADDKLRDFLKQVDAHQYTYVRPNLEGAGPGTYISPMAQELQKSEIGKSMVSPGADGLDRVDYGKGFGAVLAAQARHERRLDDVEQRLASTRKVR